MIAATDGGVYSEEVRLTARWAENFSSRSLVMNALPTVQWWFNNASENPNTFHSLNFNTTSLALRRTTQMSEVTLEEANNTLSGIYKAAISVLLEDNSQCARYRDGEVSCSETVLPLLTFSAVTRPVAYLVEADSKIIS